MDPNLHQKQGINHLIRVLNYAPFVAENGTATVYLTQEDWMVVADTLFHMETPREIIPDKIQSFELVKDNAAIQLLTSDCTIEVAVM